MRLRALDRKLLRDLVRMRWQVLAIALLIACGVSVSVMAFSAQEALQSAQVRYYRQTRFADVFATCRRAPLSIVRKLAAIDGVTAVDPRVHDAGLMDVPGLERPATAQLISLPDDEASALNRIVLVQGRTPDPERTDEAIALKTFMDAAHVTLGQRLSMVVRGKLATFRIVGAALSPEYVYTPSPDSAMPDDAHQGVLWAPRRGLEKAAGLGGAFSSVALKLAPGASKREVLAEVDRILAPYGGVAAIGREDQVSNMFLDAELKELSRSATILPPIFLIVAAGLVHMVMGRMVEVEREQIGLLKAFGYSDLEAARGYLRFAAAIGLLGGAAGGALGLFFAVLIMQIYAKYMRFPELETTFSWASFAVTALVSVAATILGSALAVRRAAALSPAVAMQPPKPAEFRRGPIERLGLLRRLDQPSRMIVRNIERFPVRAAMTVGGLAASLALLIGTQFLFHSLDYVLDHAYYRAQRWSDAVAFGEARDRRAVSDVLRLPGVIAAEPVRNAPARLQANGREKRVLLTGIEPDAQMSRPLDRKERPLGLQGRGLVISRALARRLDVKPGDSIRVEIMQGRRPSADLPVTALSEDYSGLSAYIARAELNRLLGEGDVATGAQALTAPDHRTAFYREIERTPQIVAASSRDDTVRGYRMVMTEAWRTSILFYIGFAASIAFGIAFNTGRISLAERSRDLATLHVRGFDHRECAYVLLGELFVLTLASMPLGAVLGDGFAHWLSAAYSRDEMRLPSVIGARAYAVSLTAFLAAVAVAMGLVGQRIWKLDLVAVLKTRE